MASGFRVDELAVVSLSEVVAYMDAIGERAKAEMLDRWRVARYLAYVEVVNNPYIKSVNKPRRPEDLFTLEGDRKKKQMSISAMRKRHEQILKAWMN
jgi:hypothetical protein